MRFSRCFYSRLTQTNPTMNTAKTAIFYGSTTGTAKNIAQRLAKMMNISENDVYDVSEIAPSKFGEYDNLIVGSSTWGSGELQEDWYDMADGLSGIDLSGKKVAIFGCGDETMTDTFCDAVGKLYEIFKETGASMVGAYDVVGYDYSHTQANVDGTIVGLLLDEVNHPEATDLRLRAWSQLLLDELSNK